jgi:hypothetical protein
MRVISGVRRVPALAMATSDARAQSGAPMDLYMRALRRLYPPFPTAATLANQSGEYGEVGAELGPKRLCFEEPNGHRFKLWSAPATMRVQIQNATKCSPGFSQIQPRAYFAYVTADIKLKNQQIAEHCGGDCCQVVPPVRRIITLPRRTAEPEYSR